MDDIPVDRRTALKLTGLGLAGGAVLPGSAAAKGRFEAAVLLMEAFFEGVGPEVFRNVTSSGTDALVTRGAVLFGRKPGADALGGGSFSVGSTSGPWRAEEVVRFERYGAFPTSAGAPWPSEWKGGLVELEVGFPSGPPPGVSGTDTLVIECWIGTNDSDDPEMPTQGVYLGPYDDVRRFGTVFTY